MNTEGEKRVKYRFSMIVPVYNVKRYLKRCVESLVEQEGAEAKREIILVDDGSTDGSGELCDQFAALYENVVTYHKQMEDYHRPETMELTERRESGFCLWIRMIM